MEDLVSELMIPGARNFLYIPNDKSIQSTILELLAKINPTLEISLVTLNKIQIDLPNVSNFQIAQISQIFLDLFFTKSPRLLIVESCSNLDQFNTSPNLISILALGTSFNSINDLTATVKFLSGDNIFYLAQIGYQLTSNNPSPLYHGSVITLNMLSTQYDQYLINNKNYLLNMIYPENLQRLHNLPPSRKPSLPLDYPLNEGGWVTLDLLQEVSPKIFWLIEYVKMNKGKHIVYTAFNEDLIDSFLRLSGINSIKISNKESSQNRMAKLKVFNNTLGSMVLISNLSILQPLHNVISFVMFEQHSSDKVFNNYIKNIALPNLPVLFLISLGPQNEPTLDSQNYTIMANSLNQRDAIFKTLMIPNDNNPTFKFI